MPALPTALSPNLSLRRTVTKPSTRSANASLPRRSSPCAIAGRVACLPGGYGDIGQALVGVVHGMQGEWKSALEILPRLLPELAHTIVAYLDLDTDEAEPVKESVKESRMESERESVKESGSGV